MTSASDAVGGRDRARSRVVAERQRATRAAQIAARHETLAVSAPRQLKEFHEHAAAAHRQIEARHLVTAGIQASHVARLTAWARSGTQGAVRSATAADRRVADEDAGQRLSHVNHDQLTGLPNRAHFIERLGEASGWLADLDRLTGTAPRRVGVCQIGLDRFRSVNDRLGHEVGDSLLVSIANRLTERLPGHLLARLAGDEFAVLLEDTASVDEVTKVAEVALAAINEPFQVDDHELAISASAGVVEGPAEGRDPTEVMRAADITLSWAKNSGRGRWAIFDAGRDEQTKAGYALAAALPGAIDRGELFLEYQPIVALPGGAIVAAESLVRWRHPELGVVYPDTFIDLAGQSSLIIQLGTYVLRRACRDAARWGELTPAPPTVSINIAAKHLRETDLVADVAFTLADAGLPSNRLQLEVTEGDIVHPDDQSVSVLNQLVDLGVRIAIDDFGTGYSNLSYLRRLPVQTLKIDKSFVSEVAGPDRPTDPAGLQILAAMVSLGHILGLTVTAEGVETPDQAAFLASIDCDRAQGWHFGRPMGIEAFARLITATESVPATDPTTAASRSTVPSSVLAPNSASSSAFRRPV